MTVKGCFVKVNLGTGKSRNEATYRLCQIKEVTSKDKAYKLSNALGEWCRKTLLLSWGDKEKAFDINIMSNEPPDEKNLEAWKRQMDETNTDHPSKEEMDNVQAGLERAENFVYDNSVIDSMIAGGDTTKQGNIAVRKDRLQGLSNRARMEGKVEEHKMYQAQLQELLEHEDVVKKEQGRTEKVASGVTHINARSRNKNRKTEEAIGQRNRKERVEGGDDFIRRPTRNICYFDLGGEKDATPASTPRAKSDAKELPIAAQPKSVLEKTVELHLDIDFGLLDSATPKLSCPQPTQQRPGKIFPSATMSLKQYNNLAQEAM